MPQKSSVMGSSKKHIVIWSLYIFYAYLITVISIPEISFVDIFIAQMQSVWAFYSSNFLYRHVDRYKWNGKSVLIFLGSIIGFYLIRAFVYFLFAVVLERSEFASLYNLNVYLVEGFLIYTQYSLYSLGFFFAIRAVKKEKALRRLADANMGLLIANKNLELEKENLEKRRLQTEAAFLRSQINPHFLQNTLSFLYAKTRPYSEELSEGVLLLSDIMRYSLEATTDPDDTAPLMDEIQHLKNLVALQQLRYEGGLQVLFEVEGPVETITIPPLTLVTLAENAFKYGELRDPQHPVRIQLKYLEQEGSLHYLVSNKKSNRIVTLSHGIGQGNVSSRLELKYGRNFQFDIADEEGFYAVSLVINYTQVAGQSAG